MLVSQTVNRKHNLVYGSKDRLSRCQDGNKSATQVKYVRLARHVGFCQFQLSTRSSIKPVLDPFSSLLYYVSNYFFLSRKLTSVNEFAKVYIKTLIGHCLQAHEASHFFAPMKERLEIAIMTSVDRIDLTSKSLHASMMRSKFHHNNHEPMVIMSSRCTVSTLHLLCREMSSPILLPLGVHKKNDESARMKFSTDLQSRFRYKVMTIGLHFLD